MIYSTIMASSESTEIKVQKCKSNSIILVGAGGSKVHSSVIEKSVTSYWQIFEKQKASYNWEV